MSLDDALNIVRTLLKLAGGSLITAGYFTDAQWADVTGGILALVGASWSFYAHRQKTAAVAAATQGVTK